MPPVQRAADPIAALLEGVRDGSITPEEAQRELRELPFRNLGFARVDNHRELRQGAPEAVLGEGKTPAEVVAALNKEINAALLDATIKQRLADLGALIVPPNTPAEFAKFIADDTAKWSKVIKAAGIKPQ